jgi:hypothetical protein
MGKVKLARKEDGSEQVRTPFACTLIFHCVADFVRQKGCMQNYPSRIY